MPVLQFHSVFGRKSQTSLQFQIPLRSDSIPFLLEAVKVPNSAWCQPRSVR